ncbi:MAG: FG-GAP repeat protein [Pyrinomonadaceae bacterium]
MRKVILILLLFSLPAIFQVKVKSKLLTNFDNPVNFNQKLMAADLATGATFGHTVAISGDTAVVGAWQDQIGQNRKQGSVYVFVKREGAWINQAKLIAADGRRNDYFGQSVAIDGDTIVVGVPQADIGKDKDQGAVYVFERTGDNWGKQVKLEASGGRESHLFGSSVDISGDTIVVGAPGVDNYLDDKITQAHGAAYIFTRNNDEWTEKQKIMGDSKSTAAFGLNAAISNKTAAIAAATDGPEYAIYIFSDDGTGWKKEHKILSATDADEKATGNGTSNNVAIDGNTLVVGGSNKSEKSNGAVYVYVRANGKWTRQAKLTPSNGTKGDLFGWSADISGDKIVIGEHFRSNQNRGSVYLFERKMTDAGSVWTEQNIVTAPDGFMFDQFGWSVGISGDTILVGADNQDLKQKNSNKGAAYIYTVAGNTAASAN